MRIDRLTVKNFKGFTERTFEFALPAQSKVGQGSFHVMIGENGSGKTSALDALAVALGIWHVAAPTAGWRKIEPREVHLVERRTGDTVRFDPAPSSEVEAVGLLGGKPATWKRNQRGSSGGAGHRRSDDALAEGRQAAISTGIGLLQRGTGVAAGPRGVHAPESDAHIAV